VAQSTTLDPSAVAVAVNGSLVITTANAVAADNTVDLMLPDGGTERAHVLLVDQRSGLAVLAHDTSSTVESFTVASSLVPGDVLTFYGPDPVTARVQSDGSVDVDWGSNELREGTPVVNQRGELVALCSHDDTGASLVSLANLDELRRALSATAPTTVWMGVVVADSTGTSTGLAVGDVDPSGPAAAAGIVVGDVITAIGGIAVHDSATLGAALALHSPGDSVAVDLRRSTGDVTITVVLAKPKNSQ
jgi:putative serine protease PepD